MISSAASHETTIVCNLSRGLRLDDSLIALITAARESPWLPHAARAEIDLVVAAEQRQRDPDVQSPYSAQDLRELRQSAGSAVDEALVVWLNEFDPGRDEAIAALGDGHGDALSDDLVEAVRSRTRGYSPVERFELARPALSDALIHAPQPSFLRAVRFSAADDKLVVDELIRLFDQAETVNQLSTLMSVWVVFGTTTPSLYKRLITGMYLPLIDEGPDGVAIALDFFALVSDVKAQTRDSIMRALRDHAAEGEQSERVEAELQSAGWLRRRRS
jgi:hypothetical protein